MFCLRRDIIGTNMRLGRDRIVSSLGRVEDLPEFKQVPDPANGARKPGNTAHPIVRAPSDDFPHISPFLISFHGAKRAIVGWGDHVDHDLPAGDLEPAEGLEESFHFDDAHGFRDGDDDDLGAGGIEKLFSQLSYLGRERPDRRRSLSKKLGRPFVIFEPFLGGPFNFRRDPRICSRSASRNTRRPAACRTSRNSRVLSGNSRRRGRRRRRCPNCRRMS